jgi:hypothetical protein
MKISVKQVPRSELERMLRDKVDRTERAYREAHGTKKEEMFARYLAALRAVMNLRVYGEEPPDFDFQESGAAAAGRH